MKTWNPIFEWTCSRCDWISFEQHFSSIESGKWNSDTCVSFVRTTKICFSDSEILIECRNSARNTRICFKIWCSNHLDFIDSFYFKLFKLFHQKVSQSFRFGNLPTGKLTEKSVDRRRLQAEVGNFRNRVAVAEVACIQLNLRFQFGTERQSGFPCARCCTAILLWVRNPHHLRFTCESNEDALQSIFRESTKLS